MQTGRAHGAGKEMPGVVIVDRFVLVLPVLPSGREAGGVIAQQIGCIAESDATAREAGGIH